MRKCLKIHVTGGVHDNSYCLFVQKHAQGLSIEGSIQGSGDDNVLIYACGASDSLEKFIDLLYKGSPEFKIDDVMAEPLMQERDFRGAFRIISQ